MGNTRLLKWFAATAIALILAACDRDDGDKISSKEPPQALPPSFTDVFGAQWDCPSNDNVAQITGEVRFPRGTAIRRGDILHLTLFENTAEGELIPVARKCINNIITYTFNYSIGYDDLLINNEHQYLLSSRFFRKVEEDQYQLSMAPDGHTAVITNDVTDNVNLIIESF